jgi:anti-sigma B factor antagonist
MNIVVTENGAAITLALSGRLDTLSSPELSTAINNALEKSNQLVLDFAESDYISSAGLRVLLTAQKQLAGSGSLTLTHVNSTVRDILDMTGFSDILTIV